MTDLVGVAGYDHRAIASSVFGEHSIGSISLHLVCVDWQLKKFDGVDDNSARCDQFFNNYSRPRHGSRFHGVINVSQVSIVSRLTL